MRSKDVSAFRGHKTEQHQASDWPCPDVEKLVDQVSAIPLITFIPPLAHFSISAILVRATVGMLRLASDTRAHRRSSHCRSIAADHRERGARL
jgi:hypothetical protein